jgi:hypothetical protein
MESLSFGETCLGSSEKRMNVTNVEILEEIFSFWPEVTPD